MKELLPKLIKNLDVLKSPITRLLNCFIEFYCREELCTTFIVHFATEFHEREIESEKQEILAFIFEIIKKTPKEDLERSDVLNLIRDFIMSKCFTQKRDKRNLIQKVMQMVYDRIGRFIPLEENLEYLKGYIFTDYITKIVKGDKVVLKKEDSDDSDSDVGTGYDAGADEGDIKAQIQQFNKTLKEEKMVDRLEKWMNEGSLNLSENAKFLEYLKRPEYFHLLCGLIGRPTQYQCSVTWMSKVNLDLNDPILFANYKSFTIPAKNDLFSFDFSRFNQIDYINLHGELRAIFRSYIAIKVITDPKNSKLIIDSGIKPQFIIETCIEEAKDAIKKSSGANVEHFLVLMNYCLKLNQKITLESLIKYDVLKMCSDIIENQLIQKFISGILFPAECDIETELAIMKNAKSSGLFKILTNVVAFTRKAMDFDAVEAYHKAAMENQLATHTSQSDSHLSLTIAETACNEQYALAAFDTLFWTVAQLIDGKCADREGYHAYKHTASCYAKDIFLEYLFGDELDIFNCFFAVFF